MLGEHSGENIASCISAVFKQYSITNKLGCFVLDNASNNDSCIIALAKTFNIDAKHQRLRCGGHIINLIVKAILFGKGVGKFQRQLAGAGDSEQFKLWRKRGPIGKVHNIVKYINRSEQRRQDFESLQATTAGTDKTFYYKLLQDGGIRWNSTYDMITRALKLRDALDLYLFRWQMPPKDGNCQYDLSQDKLSAADWHELTRFQALLRPFKDMTKRLEGRADRRGLGSRAEGTHGAIWEVLEAMDFMSSKLETAAEEVADEEESHYKTGVDLGWLKLMKYYRLTDETPIYRASIILHPAHKYDYFHEKWAHHPNWIKAAKTVTRDLFEQYKKAAGDESQESEPGEICGHKLEQSEFDAYRQTSVKQKKRRRFIQDELDRYIADNQDDAIASPEEPLAWWREKALKYPILSRMAFDLFSIPG